MMHLNLPFILAAILIGTGAFGVIARRNAVLVLIGVELMLNGANLLLVALDAADPTVLRSGAILTLFTIAIAAAEICVALAVILAMFRLRGDVDVAVVPVDDEPIAIPDPKAVRS